MRLVIRQVSAVVASFAVLFGVLSTPATFAAVSELDAANTLAGMGYVVDRSENTSEYRLGDSVRRQEAVAVAAQINGVDLSGDAEDYDCQGVYSDVTGVSPDEWVCRAAELAADNGIVTTSRLGEDGQPYFSPRSNVTQAEAMAMMMAASCLDPNPSSDGDWTDVVADRGVEFGVLSSAADLDANAPATRGLVFRWGVELMDHAAATPADTTGDLPGCGADPIECLIEGFFSESVSIVSTETDGVVVGTAESGASVTVTVTDSNDDTSSATGTADNNGDWTVDVDVSGLSDGSATFDVVAVSQCDEESADTASGSVDSDDDSTPTPPTGGDVEVSLSSESPTSGVVAEDTPRTAILAIDITADEDTSLEELRLDYTGLSDYNDIDTVKLYIGNDQVSKGTGKNFNDSYIEISFENDVVVEAGETITVVITAEVQDSTTNASHRVSVTDLETDGTSVSGLPVSGVSFTVIDAQNVATLDLDVDEVTGSDIQIGEVVSLAEFELEEQDDNEDVEVLSLTFTLGGSMDHQDDLSDIVLYADGEEVAADLSVNSDEEIIADLSLIVPADERVEFELMAVVTGSVGDDLSAEITEVYAVGVDTGINASTSGDPIPSSTAALRDIEGSEINVSFDKSDIDEAKPDAEEVEVGTLSLSTDGDYNIDRIQVEVDSNGGANIEDIIQRLELDGKSSDDDDGNLNTDTGVYYFDDIGLTDEMKELDLTFDVVDDTLLNGEEVTFTVSLVEIEDQDDNGLSYTDVTTPDLDSILSTNSLDTKNIAIETANITVTSTKVNDRLLVLGNGIDTTGYQAKVSVGDADAVHVQTVTFVPDTSGNHNTSDHTVSVDLDDVIDTATLTLDGVDYDGDVDAAKIEFDPRVDLAAGSDNVGMKLTLTLKDNQSVVSGEILNLDLDTTAFEGDVEDSDGNPLAVANVTTTNANDTEKTLTTLLDIGTLTMSVLNDVDSDDALENTVLAGSTGVVIAELEMEAEYEDVVVEELRFYLPGVDMSSTIDAASIVSGATTIVDGGVITFDGTDTMIEFTSDFTVFDADDLIEASLVVDLNRYTDAGDEVSADFGSFAVNAFAAADVDAQGENSNDTYTTGTPGLVLGADNAGSETIAVVPVVVTATVSNTLGNNDKYAKVTFDVDYGNNDLDNDDLFLDNVEFESIANGLELRNDLGNLVVVAVADPDLDVDVSSAPNRTLAEVKDNDEFEFKVDTDDDELRVISNGFTFFVDLNANGAVDAGEVVTSQNDNTLDLGEYNEVS